MAPGSRTYMNFLRTHDPEMRGIPLYGHMDLTEGCNLRCVHCYCLTHSQD